MIREFSAGGAVVRHFRGRPFVACIRLKGGTVLALPKGHIDPGESGVQAAAREVREETGLEAEPVRVAGVFGGPEHRITYPNGDVAEATTVVFECRVMGGELRGRDGESAQLCWFAPGEMPELLTPYPAALFERRGGPALF